MTRPLRDHRKQQDAQFAIVEKPPAMSAAARVMMPAVMARMLIAVIMVAVVTKFVF